MHFVQEIKRARHALDPTEDAQALNVRSSQHRPPTPPIPSVPIEVDHISPSVIVNLL
jgi:hypothetical protein